ncbi:MAG: diaminopimelate decarboxylase, partial [Candidatus Omnitrophica bacterium]|nr:diaminopimelate decarboxylase [Candidatus Omnitrophota bacterium]
ESGLNGLLRPTIYGAYHEIIPLNRPSSRAPKIPVDVVGPICESGDFLGKDRQLPRMKEGDLLVVKSAGAYGFTMSGNYNSRPRACEIVIRKSKYEVAKRRETYNDLIRGESIAKL